MTVHGCQHLANHLNLDAFNFSILATALGAEEAMLYWAINVYLSEG